MSRPLRVEFAGAIYHVTVRMIGDYRLARSWLFIDDKDRERFFERLADRVEQYNIRLYMFVLMTNHIHLVCETPEGNLSKFLQSLLTAYTVYYNLRHGRHGHLLDGRYKAKLVEGDEYLLSLTRYVHLNPVQVGSIKKKPIEEKIRYLRGYPWSTYLSYIGKRKKYNFIDYEPILGEMSGKKREWPTRYREFVESGLTEEDKETKSALKESPLSIGSEEFRIWIDELYNKLSRKHNKPEDVSFRRTTEPLKPGEVLSLLAEELGVAEEEFKKQRRNSMLRGIAGRYLCRYAGMSQREAAEMLNVGSGAAISKQTRRLTEILPKNRNLRRKVANIEEKLEEMRSKRNIRSKQKIVI
jgi:putative transposase